MRPKVLVTGIDGFTGRYLCPVLANCGYEVHGLVSHDLSQQIAGITRTYAGDLTDQARIAEVVHQISPNKVVHLAGVSFVGHGDVGSIYQVNIVGARHLLEALIHADVRPDSVLLASSANVYGNATGGILFESTTPAPANDYAVSKLAMEYMAKLYSSVLPIIIARPFNYTGVGQADSFLLPKIVTHVRRREALIELGNLEVARDFSDVRMVVEAYVRLLDSPAAIGKTINICSGKAHTLNDVLALVQNLSGHAMKVEVNPALIRQNEVKVLLGSRALLEQCIGPLPTFDLRETLQWMLEAPLKS